MKKKVIAFAVSQNKEGWEKGELLKDSSNNVKVATYDRSTNIEDWQAQHICICIDERPKANEWYCIKRNDGTWDFFHCKYADNGRIYYDADSSASDTAEYCYKLTAATNSLLIKEGILPISDSFNREYAGCNGVGDVYMDYQVIEGRKDCIATRPDISLPSIDPQGNAMLSVVKRESNLSSVLQSFVDKIEQSGAKIVFGLEAQGHIPYIEQTLADRGFTYHTWLRIAEHIGWDALTAVCYYHDYCNKKTATPSADDIQKMINDAIQAHVDTYPDTEAVKTFDIARKSFKAGIQWAKENKNLL